MTLQDWSRDERAKARLGAGSRLLALMALLATLGLTVGGMVWVTLGANLSGQRLNMADVFLLRATQSLEGRDLCLTGLIGADLSDASLRRADLRGADLTGANLREAELMGADLRNAVLRGARLEGARYDSSTRWPAGFDPESSSAQRIDPTPLTTAAR